MEVSLKSLIVLSSVLFSVSWALASSTDPVGCYSSVLDQAREVYGPFHDVQNVQPLEYEGSKVAIYGAHVEKNGGEMTIEAIVEKETCKVLKLYVVWSD